MSLPYDAILIVAFGGPERREDVIPFLENVLRGRNVPRERLLEVAEHYYHFGGVSPINAHVRELMAALRPETPAAFRALKGVGDKKAADLGPLFLAELAAWAQRAGAASG